MLLEPHMLAKLMKVYDPDYTGSIDFRKFTENVMGSSTMDASSIVKVDKKKAQSRADPSWTLKQLELGIKAKMVREHIRSCPVPFYHPLHQLYLNLSPLSSLIFVIKSDVPTIHRFGLHSACLLDRVCPLTAARGLRRSGSGRM